MWELSVSNVGGIRTGDVEISEGVNVVQASNFMGKSSFIAAMRSVLGVWDQYGDSPQITEGESEGNVTLTVDGETHEVTLNRSGRSTSYSGDPLLENETDRICTRLFAVLDETNPIRTAVRNGEDLTEYLQAPINIDKINTEIAEKQDERRELEAQIETVNDAQNDVIQLEEEIGQLNEELESLREERDELKEEVRDVDESSELEDKLSNKQSDLELAKRTVRSKSTNRDTLAERIEEKREKLDNLEVPDEPDFDADLDEKQEQVEEIKSQIENLRDLKSANQSIISSNQVQLVTEIDRSIEADEVECWVCGNDTTKEAIQTRLKAIDEKVGTLKSKRQELNNTISEIKKQKRQYNNKKQEKQDLKADLDKAESKLAEVENELEEAEGRVESLEAEIEELEDEVMEETDTVNEELTDIKTSISTKESRLETKRQKKKDKKEIIEPVGEIEDEITEVSDEIDALRERKNTKQRELKNEFDEALLEIIDTFAPGFDGGKLDLITDDSSNVKGYELMVGRDGRQIPITNLSEGETELIGLVIAIAGYRTYDVGDISPVIMIDGIGQLAAENLQGLVTYLEDATEVLITTAYPEAGDIGDHKIDPGHWDVVSPDTEVGPTNVVGD